MTRSTNRLNREAVAECRGLLGITRDVYVNEVLRFQSDRTRGQYKGQDVFSGAHQIELLTGMNPQLAHRILVHELVHARQAERAGSHHRFFAEYDRQLAEAGVDRRDEDYHVRYRVIPYEHEAYEVAALCHEYPATFVRPSWPFGLTMSAPDCKVGER